MAKVTKSKEPKQKRLPQMDDAKITEIHGAAEEYVDARDKWTRASRAVGERKEKLLAVMKKHGRKSYRFGELSVEVVPEGEKLKVRINAEDE